MTTARTRVALACIGTLLGVAVAGVSASCGNEAIDLLPVPAVSSVTPGAAPATPDCPDATSPVTSPLAPAPAASAPPAPMPMMPKKAMPMPMAPDDASCGDACAAVALPASSPCGRAAAK